MSNDWSRVATTTLRNYLKGYEQEVFRNYKVLAILDKRGRTQVDESGAGRQWQVQYRLSPLVSNNGEGTITFQREDQWKDVYLDWRGYIVQDAITRRERLMNRGKAALVDIMGGAVTRLKEAIRQQIGPEVYVDGGATGNEQRFHGFESFCGTNGTLDSTKAGTFTQHSATAADPVAYPHGTYGGLNTDLGYYTGSQQSGVWPLGVTDPQADFFSPLMVNYTSSYFGGASPTWADQCELAMRFLIINSQRNIRRAGQMDTLILDRELYRQALNKYSPMQRIEVSGTELRELGFKDTFMLDGCEVTWEYGLPNGQNGATLNGGYQGYGFNFECLTLFSGESQLFNPQEVTYNPETQTTRFCVDIIGNLQFESPGNFGKLGSYA